MLALNSPQWKSFETYAGLAEELPDSLHAWREAIGTADEEDEWGCLRDQFLCQHTIKDSAIAIVPHICGFLPSASLALWHYYAIDLGQVHMAWRRKPMESISPELVASYEAAIGSIRPWACNCLTQTVSPIEFRYLLSACSALCDHTGLGRFLFSLDSSPDEFPDLAGYL
jgi:hypothetical protein